MGRTLICVRIRWDDSAWSLAVVLLLLLTMMMIMMIKMVISGGIAMG